MPEPDSGSLRDVLPTAAAALGVPAQPLWTPRLNDWAVPETTKVCVFLVDGMGYELLRDRSGHAPFLTAEGNTTLRLRSEFPSTTATSLGSLGTGLPPGAHGLLGYLVRNPAKDKLMNELAWDDDVEPAEWQPHTTVFQHAAQHHVRTFQVGPSRFRGTGITEAALRGATFCSAESLSDRVDMAASMLASHEPVMVYVYWGDIDKIGHQVGCGSLAWGDELTALDSAVKSLVRRLPRGAVLMVTADHGMVDVPEIGTYDVAHHPHLAENVRYVGGEPRAPMLYCTPESATKVAMRWQEHFGAHAQVFTKQEAITADLYGPITTEVAERLGDVIVAISGPVSVIDTRAIDVTWSPMVGMHGALTSAETDIPLLVFHNS